MTRDGCRATKRFVTGISSRYGRKRDNRGTNDKAAWFDKSLQAEVEVEVEDVQKHRLYDIARLPPAPCPGEVAALSTSGMFADRARAPRKVIKTTGSPARDRMFNPDCQQTPFTAVRRILGA